MVETFGRFCVAVGRPATQHMESHVGAERISGATPRCQSCLQRAYVPENALEGKHCGASIGLPPRVDKISKFGCNSVILLLIKVTRLQVKLKSSDGTRDAGEGL